MKLGKQLRRNSLALVSLLVALSALGYNTWRNELSEHNRTVREASFRMLVHIGELQRVTYLAHYDKDTVGGNPRKGWTEILVLQDLGMLMPPEVQSATTELATAWDQNWQYLGKADAAVNELDQATDNLRAKISGTLEALD